MSAASELGAVGAIGMIEMTRIARVFCFLIITIAFIVHAATLGVIAEDAYISFRFATYPSEELV